MAKYSNTIKPSGHIGCHEYSGICEQTKDADFWGRVCPRIKRQI